MSSTECSEAETIALKCLDWLAGNDELWPVFLGSTGAAEADLRAHAADPEMLGAVLDFVLMDDEWIADCCQSKSLSPSDPMRARVALPGGANISWT